MRKPLTIVLAVTGFFAALASNPATAQTPVGGSISADTTWALADSPFSVVESVRVTGGATLTIEPGVVVRFEPGQFLSIDSGTLVARGSATSRIEFFGGRGIMLPGGAQDAVLDPDTGAYISGTVLEHVRLELVTAGAGAALEVILSSPLLRHVRVQDAAGMGVKVVASSLRDTLLEDLTISTTTETGLVIMGGRSATLRRVHVGQVAIADRQGSAMLLEINEFRDPTPAEPDIVLVDCSVSGVSARWGVRTEGGWIRTENLSIEGCDGTGHHASVRRFDMTGCRYSDNAWHLDINTAREGGSLRAGVFARGGRVELNGPSEVVGCRFEDNPSGPVLVASQGTVRECLFLNNRSAGDGGAAVFGGYVDLYDNRFEGNSAVRGGAIFANASLLTAGNTFVGNSASYGGAAWLAAGVRRSILGAPGRADVYLDNTASEAGGALHVVADEVDFGANVFEGNEAVFGGAISVDPAGSGLNLNRPEGGQGNRLVGNMALFGSDIYLARPDSAFPVANTDARCVDWGTTDPAEIADRIYDVADEPGLPEVLYLPLGPCVDCVPDLDGDGALTVFDFLAFQNLFDAGDARADLDGDGALTVFDFLAFQTAFDAGC